MTDAIATFDRHVAAVTAALADVDRQAFAQIVDLLIIVHQRGGKVLICGNGGSAATALHMATDLAKGALNGPPTGLRTFPLSANLAVLTAWANDAGYERIFAEQVATLGCPGDALVLISASGNSPNIVLAAQRAHELGVVVIGLTGCGGGELAALADAVVIVPSFDYGVVEDLHLMINHSLAVAVRAALATAAEECHVPRHH